MKTLEEFNAFADQHLEKDLQALDQQRVAGKNWLRRMWVLGLLPVILFAVFFLRPAAAAGSGYFIAIGLLTGIVLAVGAGWLLKRMMLRQPGAAAGVSYQQSFKEKVVRPIIKFINPDFSYQPLNHASYEEFTESGLFARREYNISGNDQVYGKAGNMNFQFCDLKVTHMPLMTLRGIGADVVFEGSYFIAQYSRNFHIPVYVIPRISLSEGLFADKHTETGYIETWHLGKKVLPADTAFNRQFMVYSPDNDTAQQLLTPALMQKIMALQERSQAKVFISFCNNRIYIGISHGTDYFETDINQPVTNRRMLTDFYLDFISLLQLAEEISE
ncbi:DUF3137 domain-containing protein [Chitinophaga solisilvae]|uniref:DUF3137 domain-containing protein n=1 Tax=Chitinophaga solisilvae TaxID=1233460 RepID=UPI00136C11F2|nr:DUF3137 domain-containing protein [Chitinophaga solisilvae]